MLIARIGIETTETNQPILWLANKIDAFSSSQKKMAGFFPGSRILIQDAVGVSLEMIITHVGRTDIEVAWYDCCCVQVFVWESAGLS